MEFRAPDVNLLVLLPTVIVALTAMVVLLRGALRPQARPGTVPVTLIGLAAAAVATKAAVVLGAHDSFGRMLILDRAAGVFYLVFLATTMIALLLAADHLDHEGLETSETAALMCLSCVGMMIMASSGNLIMIFIGLETMSVALYILSGLAGMRDRGSTEAALKYLLLGAFATGFLVYGMAFLYGGAGSLDLGVIGAVANSERATFGFVVIGLALLGIGLAFKVALVPFHMWAPDVYEGAPTPVTAFMSVGAKVAGFAAMVRVFDVALLPLQANWLPALWGLAVLTMLVGNVVALSQTSLKRLLAYSSVAHAGYLTIGVVAAGQVGAQGILFYALAYAFMNLGAFAVLAAVGGEDGRPRLEDIRGLGRRAPVLAGSMALFMFALAGVPPLSGFIGKWLLFSAAVQEGQVLLAVLAVLCSAISAFYYLRVVVFMFMHEPAAGAPEVRATPRTTWALWACVAGTVLLSFPLGLPLARLAGWAAAGLGG